MTFNGKVRVLDACPGSGKTTKLIKEIAEMPVDSKIIYVTPMLSECHRVAGTYALVDDNGNITGAMKDCGEVVYDLSHPLHKHKFQHPTTANVEGSKLVNLKELLSTGANIVTTHALFRSLSAEILSIVKQQGYTLIVDEVLSTYETYEGSAGPESDIISLYKQGILYLDSDGFTLRWDKSKLDATNLIYSEIMYLMEVGCLLLVDGRAVVWELPLEVITSFKAVTVATYMWEGSYMAGYFKFHGIGVDIESWGLTGKDFKNLITIIDDEAMNAIGNSRTALSKAWSTNNKAGLAALKGALSTFFKYRTPLATSQDKLWTCYKNAFPKLKGMGYTKNWIACGTKSTNDYANTKALAYCVNLFYNPMLVKLFAMKDIDSDQDRYALSEMVQWVYRSQIRNGGEITLYIPSKRMRGLLVDWLDDKF